jgi:hypothetical protein
MLINLNSTVIETRKLIVKVKCKRLAVNFEKAVTKLKPKTVIELKKHKLAMCVYILLGLLLKSTWLNEVYLTPC